MFSSVQDPLPPARRSPLDDVIAAAADARAPAAPALAPVLLPFFPPSAELSFELRGRRFPGPEQCVQVRYFESPACLAAWE
jgi:hypothetical protein